MKENVPFIFVCEIFQYVYFLNDVDKGVILR